MSLDKVQVLDTTFDRCPSCRGAWFDAGEIATIEGDATIEQELATVPEHTHLSRFGCPRCAGDCLETRLGDVVTDTCSSCGGVWVDAGEIESARRVLVPTEPKRGLRAVLARI